MVHSRKDIKVWQEKALLTGSLDRGLNTFAAVKSMYAEAQHSTEQQSTEEHSTEDARLMTRKVDESPRDRICWEVGMQLPALELLHPTPATPICR